MIEALFLLVIDSNTHKTHSYMYVFQSASGIVGELSGGYYFVICGTKVFLSQKHHGVSLLIYFYKKKLRKKVRAVIG